jgi:hypothetical protein
LRPPLLVTSLNLELMISRITRGRTFGTILGDMQSRQVIDLLPDRAGANR